MHTPVRLHYVDNIYYVVKLCTCLHNAMVVQHIENREDPETEDMYDVTIHNANILELNKEDTKDNAHINIKAEDIFYSKSTQIITK